MILLKFKIEPVYIFRPDWRYEYDEHKYVLLRNIVYTIIAKCAGSEDLDESAEDILDHLYIRLPDSDTMQQFEPPDLTGMGVTLYNDPPYKEGSDYITLDSSFYDWRVVNATNTIVDLESNVTETYYIISGRWKYYQGVCHNIQRRV